MGFRGNMVLLMHLAPDSRRHIPVVLSHRLTVFPSAVTGHDAIRITILCRLRCRNSRVFSRTYSSITANDSSEEINMVLSAFHTLTV